MVWTGLLAGIGLGLLNLLASNWTARRAARLGPFHAVQVMVLGLVVRLGVLALMILAVPPGWMQKDVFVVTFVAAFLLGLAVEARVLVFPKPGVEPEENR